MNMPGGAEGARPGPQPATESPAKGLGGWWENRGKNLAAKAAQAARGFLQTPPATGAAEPGQQPTLRDIASQGVKEVGKTVRDTAVDAATAGFAHVVTGGATGEDGQPQTLREVLGETAREGLTQVRETAQAAAANVADVVTARAMDAVKPAEQVTTLSGLLGEAAKYGIRQLAEAGPQQPAEAETSERRLSGDPIKMALFRTLNFAAQRVAQAGQTQ